MNLYLLRHGIAVERGSPGFKDKDRPLTQEGKDQMELVANAMKRAGLRLDRIISSPYVRALDTARICAKKLTLEDRLETSENLASGQSTKKIIEAIQGQYGTCEHLLLVGHEPDFSMLVSRLCAGNESTLNLSFKKAGLCKIKVFHARSGLAAEFKWMLTPKLMISLSL